MPRNYRFALLTVLVAATLACGLFTRPLSNVAGVAQTAQAFATSMPVGTLEALPSAFPSLEAIQSAMPTLEGLFNPTGVPVASWNDIPIMPQATVGGESSLGTYSFRAPVSLKDVQDYYTSQLEGLGWKQVLSMPATDQMAVTLYQKDNQTLSITATAQGGEVVVLLALQ